MRRACTKWSTLLTDSVDEPSKNHSESTNCCAKSILFISATLSSNGLTVDILIFDFLCLCTGGASCLEACGRIMAAGSVAEVQLLVDIETKSIRQALINDACTVT